MTFVWRVFFDSDKQYDKVVRLFVNSDDIGKPLFWNLSGKWYEMRVDVIAPTLEEAIEKAKKIRDNVRWPQ